MENLYTKNCIRTFTGKYIDPLNPDPDLICIEDIAHALSQQPRFLGHLKKFYSVAQHSVSTAFYVAPKNQLAALLHDASEAYLCDIPSPIKERLPAYKEGENRLMKAISSKFGFEFPLCEDVKKADRIMLEREWDGLVLRKKNMGWVSYSSKTSETLFLKVYESLRKGIQEGRLK